MPRMQSRVEQHAQHADRAKMMFLEGLGTKSSSGSQ